MPARTEPDSVPERRGVYLLTLPRSASNLFQTMMAKQPGYQNSGYKLFEPGFAALGQLGRGPLSQWPEEDRNALYTSFEKGWEGLQDEVADAKKNGKEAFIKEHTMFLSGPDKIYKSLYSDDVVEPLIVQQRDSPNSAHTNPTSLPDEFLLSMQPIFQIRHPALMFPSMIRAQKGAMPDTNTKNPRVFTTLTLSHSRALYDWYLAHSPRDRRPRVIDADDIMNDPAAVRQLCVETGLDPDAVQYEWEERHEDNPLKASFLSTIYKSKGIVKGLDSKGIDVDAEKMKWEEEFGEEGARDLEKCVEAAMGDYGYLLGQRTCIKKL